MKLGSLFSGGGLGDFGFMAAGMEIAWQCEIDEYCQKILALRYPESKKYRDIKILKGAELEPVDIITGGFPCQPFSVAGKQKGKEDNRYLWPEMLRVIKECRPRWIVGENVPGIINLALDTVCSDLEAEGYEVWPIVFPSHALGAWHKRDRLWIICHAKHDGQLTSQESRGFETRSGSSKAEQKQASEPTGPSEQYAPMADTQGTEQQRKWGTPWSWRSESGCSGWWAIEPSVGRVANGITDRVHRLKMLGNGQVPACTYVIGKMIMDIGIMG
jgi:DNA (cytosine-5)-methyltransferase 1